MKTKTFFKWLCCSAILLIASVQPVAADDAINFSGGYIYFDNSLSINKGYIQLCARQAGWTGVSTLSNSNLSHTKLYYVKDPQGSGWGGIKGWVVISNSTEKSNGNFDDWSNQEWCTNWNTYGFYSGSTYLIVPSSTSKSQSVTTTYYATGYSGLNNSQTVYKYTSTGGTTAASYTGRQVNSGTVTISAYKMTDHGKASNSNNSGTINNATTTSVSKDAAYTGEVTLEASANDGYSFIGWFENTTATTAVETETSYTYNAPNSTKSIYARFKENQYSITFDANGGSGEMTSQTGLGCATAQTIKANSFTAPTGHHFNGWNTQADGEGIPYAAGGTVPALTVTTQGGTLKLYAQWAPNTHTLTWNWGGGSTTDQNYTKAGTVAYGTSIVYPTNASMSYAGHNFTGWSPASPQTMPDADMTITAQWEEAASFKVTYAAPDKTSGDVPTDATEYTLDAQVTVLDAGNLARTGYDFAGWKNSVDNITYTAGQTFDISSNTTLTAQWTAHTYTLTYEGLEGTTHTNPETYTVETETFSFTAPSAREGYTFAGWTPASITKGTTGDKTITATWTPNPNTAYQVKHYWQNIDNNDYSLHETENLTGTTATEVTPATKHYEGFTAPSTQTKAIAADGSMVIEYRYTRNEHTLTWEPDGGTLSGTYTSGTVKYGTTIVAPTASKFGKLFNAWSAGVPATMPDNDVTLTANYVNAYFFIEGRFHVANAERTPHGAVWTNTFTSGDWATDSRTIPMVWNEDQSRYEVRTYATPKELSTEISNQYPFFFIKASESATEWTGEMDYYAATEDERPLTTENKKSTVGTVEKFFYFNSEDNSKWTILCYDAEGVYFELEDIPPYYSINVSVAEGDENKGTVKPTVMNEINTLAYGTAKAESKDPQLYSFEKWGWKSSKQTEESFDFTNASGVILHDSCQNTWPEIRVNAAGTDLMLIAHFKAREIVTIYFVDSENWGTNIRMHLWGGFEQGTTWPGIKPNETDLTCNGHTVYSYTFDKGAYEKVKWSNNGNDKSSNFIIDSEQPYYNEHDGRWYDALSSVGPDKNICANWRIVFNNSDEYFKLVEGQTDIYECFLANVPAWEKEGDNWVKMKYKSSGDWDWRGFTGISNNQKVESYVSATYTASTNNSNQNQLNLAGIEVGQTQDFVLTFNTSNLQLTISKPTPKVEIGVKNQAGTAITEYDIDSEDGFLLNAYPQNVDKDAQCTYSFQYKKDNGSWTSISGATAKSSTIMGSQLDGPGVYKFRVIMTIGGHNYESTASADVTIYKYYWLALKERQSGDEWVKNIHLWGGTGEGTTWPGVALTEKQTVDGVIVHYYKFKYPTYKQYKYNNGNGEGNNQDQTGDFTLDPDNLKICHHITGGSWNSSANRNDWSTEEMKSCPSRLFISNDKNSYEMTKDGSIELNPTITYYGTEKLQYTWSAADDNIVVAYNGASAVVSPKAGAAAKQTELTLSVMDNNGQYAEYKFYITVKDGILIRVWNRYGIEYTSTDYWVPIIHIWADGKNAENHNMVHDKNGWCTYIVPSDWKNIGFYIAKGEDDIGGDGYVKSDRHDHATVSVGNVNESGCWSVSDYKTGDGFHTLDKTEDCEIYFRVKSVMSDGKTAYYSNKVTAAGSQISFYADKAGTLVLQRYDEGTKKFEDVKTLTLASPLAKSYVYTATFTGNDITDMTKYIGDYYIRTDAASGGWSSYTNVGNKFTSFTRNPLFGNEKYNYYWVTTIKDGKNAKAEVGNTINKSLAQTIGDYVCDHGDANVRFGYCPETNYFTRAIIAGSSVADYLTLYGDNSTYFNGGQDNSTLYTDEQLTHKIYDGSQLKFKDLSDWVYEAEVYAAVDVTRPSDTKAVIKSKYHNQIDYLLGYDSENQRPSYAYTVLGNTSTKNMTFKITVTYDYKMNRLTTAWKPLAGEIDGHLSVDAAIMFVNPVDKGDEVQQITVKDKDSDISSLNNIVYVMEFEENVEHPTRETNHWISLPFDCRISDIYGIEGYVTLNSNKMPTDGVWGIQRYDGEARAQKGRMKQTDTYWTWMSRDEELIAGEGYVLSFDRGAIDWPEIEGTRIKRLYFQSKNAGFTLNLSKSEAIQTVEEHEENASLHRYGEDANWNLIGPLAYNNITINNLSDEAAAPKFLYKYLGKNTEYIEGIGKYQLVNPLEETAGNKFEFVSFHSYMVQFAGTINWAQYTQTQHDNPATAPLLASADDEFTYTQVRLNLSKEGQQMDKTYVCLSEYGTTGYDLNDDLSKITEAKANQIGSVVENRVYAANTLPLETEVVALYVNAAATGEYVIALNQENPYLKVALLDAQTGKTTLLDDTDYTITLDKGEYKDRFFLQFVQKSPLTPTNFNGTIEQFNLPTDKTQKLLINDNIYLINAGRIYNASGTKVR